VSAWEQLLDHVEQLGYALPSDRRAEQHRVHLCPGDPRGQFLPAPREVEGRTVVEVASEELVVDPGQGFDEQGEHPVWSRIDWVCVWPTQVVHRVQRHSGRRELGGDLGEQLILPCASTVDLVDEQQGRYPQPVQSAHQDPGLRLYALDRRDDQYHRVQHPQAAFDLGDEVRVARGVDQVDQQVIERKRHNRGVDRDTSAAFQL
jgi:hypothetical protein